jgi:hypothetical protein
VNRIWVVRQSLIFALYFAHGRQSREGGKFADAPRALGFGLSPMVCHHAKGKIVHGEKTY